MLDGTSLLPFVKPGSNPDGPRPLPLIFSFGPKFNSSQQAIIDNDWKILTAPSVGQCDAQPGFNFSRGAYPKGKMFLYNLKKDVHETTDISDKEPEQFERMKDLLLQMRDSIMFSRVHETKCQPYAVKDSDVQHFHLGI